MTTPTPHFPTRKSADGIVLALGGGGARGLAHLGALELLAEHGIRVEGVAGTSSGGLVAAMWLAYGGVEPAVRRWHEYLEAGFPASVPGVRLPGGGARRFNPLRRLATLYAGGVALARAVRRSCVVDPELSRRVLEFLVPDVTIESLPLPLALVATDYRSGDAVVLTKGSLRHAVKMSCAMPGMVIPQHHGHRLLIDGGVVAEVPVEQARELFDRPVVAIDTPEDLPDELPDRPSVPRAFIWADTLTHRALRRRLLASADLVIAPVVAHIHWSEFGRIEEAMKAGTTATASLLPRLRTLCATRSVERSA